MVIITESNASNLINEEDEEEPGEVIESAPPLKVGEERTLGSSGIKKKLLKCGSGFQLPDFGDEVTIKFVGCLLDGTRFAESDDRNYKVGSGEMVSGLDRGIVTMKKGEKAIFTLPPELAYGEAGRDGVPPNSYIKFKVELISWITVIDVSKDGGVIKRVVVKGEQTGKPCDLDEVLVKYVVTLADGTLLARTPEEGVEFYVNDGHLCPALPKAIKTMNRGDMVNLEVQPKCMDGLPSGWDAYQGGSTNPDYTSHVIPPNSVLSIDLELLSFKPVISVTNDSKVMKKILKEGQGALTADEGAVVTVRYKAMLKDGCIFEKKGYDGEGTLEFITGEEQVIAGLDHAAMTMKKGEHAIITVDPLYGFGNVEVRRDLATVPSSSTLSYEVEMLDFVKEKEPWEMIGSERVQAAERKKDEGNVLFKNGKYQRALKKYDKAATYVGEDGCYEDDNQKLVQSLRVSCWLNNAACCLRLNNFQAAIALCSKVLDIEFYNVKALYRRSQAYIEIADYQLAEVDIKKALEADPGNREVKAAQHKLKQLQAESNKRDAKLYSNMFSQMTKRLKLENVEDS
ncbi:Peptidylprolyl isomerase [Heracleum sosnowskyi]|uniref:peptidylprolyl isomerase n=1 Tax=Heracleum sosnowskyi TaxID=360622 RepID=A0AAD8IYX0_9APIA|nr:Peptidylprolyl isomerase [Heracleum sosnowskyi]